MDWWVWVIIAAVVVVVAVAVAVAISRQRRRAAIASGFGPELDRTVKSHGGDRRAAVDELVERSRKRDSLDVHPLSAGARERYRDEWRALQARFVDEPARSLTEADVLLDRVMEERGYPVTDFDEKAAVVSVDHPEVVQNYRAARELRQRNSQQMATTDELRQGILLYRSLFDELLDDGRIDASGQEQR